MSDTQPQTANEATNLREQPGKHDEPIVEPQDIAPPLASLVAAIRAALIRGASADVRAAGATACRSILTVLEAKPGQPLASAPPSAAPASQASPIAALLSQPGLLSKLAAMSRDELINVLKQVTGATPVRAPTPSLAGPRFHLIEIPQARKPDGSR